MGVDISVIVPVFNTEKYLRGCIDSIINQTIFPQMEVVLVDDGSLDGAPEICDIYTAEHANIHVVHQRNAGVSAARNTGIAQAKGKYIGFVDSDDYINPEMFEKLLEAAEETNADMSFCGFISEYPEKIVNISYPFRESVALNKTDIIQIICPFMLRDESFNACWNKIFKREKINTNLLIFNVKKKQGEDREFLLNFLACAKIITYINYLGYYYRLVPTGAIQKPRIDYAQDILSQHKSDFTLFERIGLKHETIIDTSAFRLFSQVISALSFSINRHKGRDRRDLLKSIILNREIRKIISNLYPDMIKRSSKFNRCVYTCFMKKSINGLILLFFVLKLKVSLCGFVKKGVES